MTRIALHFAISLVALGVLLPAGAASSETVSEKWLTFQPKFVESDCWFLKAGETMPGVVCGTVAVPEDRTNPASRLISIAVMKVAAVSQPAPSGTLLWLESGPASASISAGRARAATSGWLAALHDKSDLLFFDQRGTGYSERDFCRMVRDAFTYGVRVEPEGEARFRAEMRQCLDQARAEGIPTDAYSHWQIALDARDIRMALGLDGWNVFGFLTSTEIAQAIIQVDPEGVRAAILDSPFPTGRPLSGAFSLMMDRALRALSEICRQSPRCAQSNGDLHQRVLTLLDDLERAPILIEGLNPKAADNGRLVFDDRIAATFLMFMIYDSASHADLPAVLSAIERRDRRALHTYAQAWFQPPDGRRGQAVRYAIKCRNNCGGLGLSPAALAQAEAEAPALYRRLGLFRYADDCAALNFGPPDPSVRATHSDRPILIADGRLDPVQPHEASQALAASFPHGQFVLFPYGGVMPITSQMNGCGGEILRAFLANPMAPVDDRCVQASGPPVFLTDYRKTSAPGSMLLRAATGDYPIVPILLIVALTVPFLALPVVWARRRLSKKEPSRRAVPPAELMAWLSLATALGALAHFAYTLVGWFADHPAALPAGVPSSVLVSAALAAGALLLAFSALALARKRSPSPWNRMTGLTSIWAAIASASTFLWMITMI